MGGGVVFRKFNGFWNGFVSAFQLFPTRGCTPPPPYPSDAEAIRGDWEEVGDYLHYAIKSEIPVSKNKKAPKR